MSQSKNRIFIGNVPRKWEESDLKNAVAQVGPGVIRVDLMKVQFCFSAPINIGNMTFTLRKHKAISCNLMLLCFSKRTPNCFLIRLSNLGGISNALKGFLGSFSLCEGNHNIAFVFYGFLFFVIWYFILLYMWQDSVTGRSRGFGFVEYYNHACADYSLKKLSKPDFKLDTNSPTISWADPRGSTEPGTKSQVGWCVSVCFLWLYLLKLDLEYYVCLHAHLSCTMSLFQCFWSIICFIKCFLFVELHNHVMPIYWN